MKLVSRSFPDGARIPTDFAMGVPGDAGPVPGPNKSPQFSWSDAPPGTRAFAMICHDRDVPSKPDDVNKTDRTVAYDLPRVDFYHWVLVDIPESIHELAEGADGSGIIAKGKPASKTEHGRRGVNNYTDWFGDDPAMGGTYGGYDGPWPPFNDERIHHYVFTLYALDTAELSLPANFKGPDAIRAMKGHVLASATWSGTYALNPNARE